MNIHHVTGTLARKELWRRRIARIVAILAPLIIGTVALLLVQQLHTANELRTAEKEAVERRAALQTVLSAHQDIETGARGYLITGDAEYLAPFRSGKIDLAKLWPELQRMYADNPKERALVGRLHDESLAKQRVSQRTVDLTLNGARPAAEANVANGPGRLMMDRIRELLAQLTAHEQERLATSTRSSEGAIFQLRVIMIGLLATLTVLLLAAWIAMQNLLRLRDAALGEIEDLSLRREAIVDSVSDAIVTLNPSGSIESANPATLRMFGHAAEDLIRRDVGVLFAHQPPIGAVAERLREFDTTGADAGPSREILGRRADGQVFATEVAVSSMRLNEGMRYVAVIRDVTERKRVEQLKAEFVSTVSHELRTPLTSIAGALGLLNGGAAGELGARASRLIGIASNNADRLVRLINDILDIEKIESGKMRFDNRELDLKATVAASIEENRNYAANFDVRIALSAPMQPMHVHADKDRLAQVLTNLISNAAKFSPKGGVVDVSIAKAQGFYRVTVADKGPGIPDEFRSRIFGKFAQADSSDTREKGGTGLGLSIVAQIVQRLNGKVSFDSEPGRGSRFHVDLPIVDVAPAAKPAATRKPALLVCSSGSETVLCAALRKAGHSITLARSADAMDAALSKRRYDGIVIDIALEGGSGIRRLRSLRESGRNAQTPILALGSHAGDGGLEGHAALVIDWFRKPLNVKRLIDSVGTASVLVENERPRVLHVEDDPDVVRLVAEALDGRAEVIAAEGVAAAKLALATIRFDLAIIDLGLADGNGAEILPYLGTRDGAALPVVIFSAQDADEETATMVDAYLTKARTPIAALVSLVENLTATQRREDAA